jgi:hypothetical protein
MDFDIIFISYDEENAEENWLELQKIYPQAKRVHKIKGIREAHAKASELSSTEFFFTIDGDNRFIENITLSIPSHLKNNTVYVWRCQNAVNGLIYGYGGLKLWPKAIFERHLENYGDHAMSATEHYQVVHQLATQTHFNTSAFSAWKSGFREACKLVLNVKKNVDNYSKERLVTWMTTGEEVPYGKYCIQGARQGCVFAWVEPENTIFNLINNFENLHNYYAKNKSIELHKLEAQLAKLNLIK